MSTLDDQPKTPHILQVVPGIWTWSVRPDLWPAGQHLRVYSVCPGTPAWAWYAYSQRSARLDLQRAERDGAGRPGVAEAAILAPGVVVVPWD